MRRKPRQPRQDTESRKERKPMEGTQFLYCETRKGNPRVNIEVCQAKCKKATKCKPLKEYQATGDPTEPNITDSTDSDRFENFIDNELDQERRADPNHPINRNVLKTPGEEEVILDSDKATPIKQLDLFDFIDDPGRKE